MKMGMAKMKKMIKSTAAMMHPTKVTMGTTMLKTAQTQYIGILNHKNHAVSAATYEASPSNKLFPCRIYVKGNALQIHWFTNDQPKVNHAIVSESSTPIYANIA